MLYNPMCNYGCEGLAIKQFKIGTWCCSDKTCSCPGQKYKFSETSKKRVPWNKGLKNCFSEESRKKLSDSLKKYKKTFEHLEKIASSQRGKKRKSFSEKTKLKLKGRVPWNKGLKNCFSEETRRKISIGNIGKNKNSNEFREKMRQKLLNGQSILMIKAIKKISYEEKKLKKYIEKIIPSCKPQYKVLNYAIDIAICEYKIAIEYDGYYHFDTIEHIEYHKMRQKKIENEGWTFIRYTLYEKFPCFEKVKNDIFKVLKKVRNDIDWTNI